jgi:hypothetical protein
MSRYLELITYGARLDHDLALVTLKGRLIHEDVKKVVRVLLEKYLLFPKQIGGDLFSPLQQVADLSVQVGQSRGALRPNILDVSNELHDLLSV